MEGLKTYQHNPLSYVSSTYDNPNLKWVNSQRLNNAYYDGFSSQFAITSSRIPLNLPIKNLSPGAYSVWIKVLVSNNSVFGTSGNDLIQINNRTIGELNLSQSIDGGINNFYWVKLETNVSQESVNLSINPISGTTAIKSVVFAPKGYVSTEYKIVESWIPRSTNIITLYPAYNLNYVGSAYYQSYNGKSANGVFVNGNALVSNLNSSFTLESPFYNGWLYMYQFSPGFQEEIKVSKNTLIIGADTQFYGREKFLGLMQIPIAKNISNSSIQVINRGGVVWTSIVIYSSRQLYGLNASTPVEVGTLSSVSKSSGISNFTFSVNQTNRLTTISGNFTYSNITTFFPLSLFLNGSFDYELPVSLAFNVTENAIGYVNGIRFSGNSYSPFIISPGMYYYQHSPDNIEIDSLLKRRAKI